MGDGWWMMNDGWWNGGVLFMVEDGRWIMDG